MKSHSLVKRYDTLCIRPDKIPKAWELLGRKEDDAEEMYTLEVLPLLLELATFMQRFT